MDEERPKLIARASLVGYFHQFTSRQILRDQIFGDPAKTESHQECFSFGREVGEEKDTTPTEHGRVGLCRDAGIVNGELDKCLQLSACPRRAHVPLSDRMVWRGDKDNVNLRKWIRDQRVIRLKIVDE